MGGALITRRGGSDVFTDYKVFEDEVSVYIGDLSNIKFLNITVMTDCDGFTLIYDPNTSEEMQHDAFVIAKDIESLEQYLSSLSCEYTLVNEEGLPILPTPSVVMSYGLHNEGELLFTPEGWVGTPKGEFIYSIIVVR